MKKSALIFIISGIVLLVAPQTVYATTCTDNTQCPPTQFCNFPSFEATDGACTDKPGGNVEITGFEQTKSAAGGPCLTSDHCQAGLICDSRIKQCIQIPSDGEAAENQAAAPAVITPKLSIPIPGIPDKWRIIEAGEDKISIPWIAQYVVGLYKYALKFGAILAVVVFMVGGLLYMTAGGLPHNIDTAKTIMFGSITGLALILSANLLLSYVNPNLTTMQPITIEVVKEIKLEIPLETEEDINPTSAPNGVKISGDNISNQNGSTIDSALLPDIQAAALSLKDKEIQLGVVSGIRTVQKQESLIKQNCICTNQNDIKTCGSCKPPTCLLKKGPTSCPHTTGRAVDAWGLKKNEEGKWAQCVKQKQCLDNKSSCFNDPCQKAVIDAMKAQGFCVLDSEPWHFEKPKMSGNCH